MRAKFAPGLPADLDGGQGTPRRDRAGVGHGATSNPLGTDAGPGSGSVPRAPLQAFATAPVTGRKNGGVLRTRREEIAMASVPSARSGSAGRAGPAPAREPRAVDPGLAVARCAAALDLQHAQPRAHRDPVLLLVPDAVGPAQRDLHRHRVPGDKERGGADADDVFTLAAIKGVELAVFIFFFGLVTVLGFVAARWHSPAARAPRRVGPRRAQLRQLDQLVPDRRRPLHGVHLRRRAGALFGTGALGFFAVPYTIIVFPIVFMIAPRLWSVAHRAATSRRRTSSAAATGPRRSRWDRGHRHRRDDAVHRAPARRHRRGPQDDGDQR